MTEQLLLLVITWCFSQYPPTMVDTNVSARNRCEAMVRQCVMTTNAFQINQCFLPQK